MGSWNSFEAGGRRSEAGSQSNLIINHVMLNLFQHPIRKVCDIQVCNMQIADLRFVDKFRLIEHLQIAFM